ncbi:alpha-ketoacid dehydrogenase subunit beta, partial [Staphylococcus epidermidis]|nr:alpha-ketoacid dehydrogenase subunit beta [Staphylococcus epidermidis]
VAEETADRLEEDNVSVEVIDLRSVSPWDQDTVLESVKKTGRLIVIDESSPQCNIAGDVASVIGDIGFDYLDGPIKKVTAPDTPVPFASNLEATYIPNADKVLDVASELVDDLKKANA